MSAKDASRCLYCRDLTYEEEKDQVKVQAAEWVKGLRTASCSYCRLLLHALECAESPELVQYLTTQSDATIEVLTLALGLVFIHIYYADGTSKFLSEFQICTTEDSKLNIGSNQSFRDVAPTAGDASMWDFLQQSLTTCLETHEQCKASQRDQWIPTRLLYCGENDIRLVDTRLHEPSGRYIALSYCWGDHVPLHTTTTSLPRLQEGIVWNDIPRVFQDAIATARELGVQYLWIDSLCIIQDDRSDWARHSQTMGDIYRNALLTIGVVMSPDSRSPFLGPDAPAAKTRLSVQTVYSSYIDDEYGPISFRVRKTARLRVKDCAFRGPLMKRGWTYQERLLSTRIVDFTDSVVTWNCVTTTLCEHGIVPRGWTGDKAPPPTRTDQNIDVRPDAWRRVTRDFSERRLTYPTDRLPALSGIASYFQAALRTQYLAGLWHSDMTRCLGWFLRLPNRKKANALRKPQPNALPSWSWASVEGEINYCTYVKAAEILRDEVEELPTEVEFQGHIELLRTQCTPSTDNALGELTPGSYIDVRGRVIEADWESDMYGAGCVRRAGLQANIIIPDCLIVSEPQGGNHCIHRQSADSNATVDSTEARVQGKVFCLLLYTVPTAERTFVCILIISRRENGVYERVGLGASKSVLVDGETLTIGPGGADFVTGNDKKWEGWEDLGTWENWEEWFADAETRAVRIV